MDSRTIAAQVGHGPYELLRTPPYEGELQISCSPIFTCLARYYTMTGVSRDHRL